jgi:hypothetical protein
MVKKIAGAVEHNLTALSVPVSSRKKHIIEGGKQVTPKSILSEQLRQTERHNEWLLDEALTETFPASDPIAVSPSYPRQTSSPRGLWETERSGAISNCNIGHGKQLKPDALKTPIVCDYCHTEIPATVTLSFEGVDYIYEFCGPLCLDAWCKATGSHDK